MSERTVCERYVPSPEWRRPPGYDHFNDIPNDLRYSDCLCGRTWASHHRNRR